MQPNPMPAKARPADNTESQLYMRDVLSVRQFSPDLLKYVFGVADDMRSFVERFGSADLLQGKNRAGGGGSHADTGQEGRIVPGRKSD